jgi:hypothetical protein
MEEKGRHPRGWRLFLLVRPVEIDMRVPDAKFNKGLLTLSQANDAIDCLYLPSPDRNTGGPLRSPLASL